MRISSRNIRAKLESGDRVFGTIVQTPSPEVVEIVGYTGFDFVWLDAEHGTMDLRDIAVLVRSAEASGMDTIVRVPDANPSFIQRVLDIGATGILVPHVRSADNAAAIVAAAKFPPLGVRGACPATRATGHYTENWIAECRRADQDTIVWGLIEDIEGVEDIEKIVAVPGLDGIIFGPFDLAQSMGFDGDISRAEIVAMHSRVAKAARMAGVEMVSIAAWEPGGMQGIIERDARIVCHGGDRGLLVMGFRETLRALAEGLATPGEGMK
jgi:2-keto-3-deoxy-L-rhamnonate aldolase RhmA